MNRILEKLLRLVRAVRRALRSLGPYGWLSLALSLALFLAIAAFSFLLGLKHGLGMFLLVILLTGVLCGRFLNLHSYPFTPPVPPPAPAQFTPEEIAEIGEWLIQVGAYLGRAAQLLEVSVGQQREDAGLIQKLAEVYEAAQILCLEIEAAIKQGQQQTYRLTSEVYKELADAVDKIDVAETVRLSLSKRRRSRS